MVLIFRGGERKAEGGEKGWEKKNVNDLQKQ